jgi:hypothetical protein
VTEDGKVKPVKVGLQIIPVYLYDVHGNTRKLNIFLDDGSDASYAACTAVQNLGLPVEENQLTISTLTTQAVDIPSGRTVLTIESLDENLQSKIGVRVIEQQCKNMKTPNRNRLRER